MATRKIFSTDNMYWQAGAQGICTAASLAWCRKTLQIGNVDSFDALGVTDHSLNAQMAVLRRHDGDPVHQSDLAGLRMVGDSEWDIDQVGHVTSLGKDHPNAAVIFWTEGHTMAYRYQSEQKDFFDIEVGAFRAKLTKDIEATMREVTANYGPLTGARVVALKD